MTGEAIKLLDINHIVMIGRWILRRKGFEVSKYMGKVLKVRRMVKMMNEEYKQM